MGACPNNQSVAEAAEAAETAQVESTASAASPAPAPIELDLLYNEVDKLYHAYARGCGLSDCAYWMLYDIEQAGGSIPLARLTESWSYSKQTINSALKVLQERGLIVLAFLAGSRKSKLASFTDEGRAFSAEHIVPAIEAEQRAFASLTEREQSALVCLVRRYADALERQIAVCLPGESAAQQPAEATAATDRPVPRPSADAPLPTEPAPSAHAPT